MTWPQSLFIALDTIISMNGPNNPLHLNVSPKDDLHFPHSVPWFMRLFLPPGTPLNDLSAHPYPISLSKPCSSSPLGNLRWPQGWKKFHAWPAPRGLMTIFYGTQPSLHCITFICLPVSFIPLDCKLTEGWNDGNSFICPYHLAWHTWQFGISIRDNKKRPDCIVKLF